MPSTNSDNIACPVLTGPNEFQVWKLRIIAKLRCKKGIHVVTGAELKPSTPITTTTTATTSASSYDDWETQDEKALGIIQEYILNTLLLKTAACTTSKELFDK